MTSLLKTAPTTEPVSENRLTSPRPRSTQGIYSNVFWMAYIANVAVVTANGLTFRFAELVGFLGGSERTAGFIIGLATATALFLRLFLGQAIDRYGVRRLWLISSVVFVLGGALLTTTTELGSLLALARSLFAIGLAGMLTCSTVHIQTLVPPERRTEIIASLGSSGFVGMILGTVLGDAIFLNLDGQLRFTILFGLSTTLGLLYIGVVHYITRTERHRRPSLTPALHQLIFRYWPGNVLSVAFVMGMMLAVTTVFLTRFATHNGLTGIGVFFTGYAISAFTFRIASRGWSRTLGRHRMILLGLAGHAVAMFILPFATTNTLFVLPAIFGGFGHALLFPAVVSLGSEAFPRKFRGTGTTVIMGFFEVGTVVSAPVLGTIIDLYDGNGFTPMFVFAGCVAVAVGIVYQLTTARTADSDLLLAQSHTGNLIATGPHGSGPFLMRHSPIEPAAPRRSEPSSSLAEPEDVVEFNSVPILTNSESTSASAERAQSEGAIIPAEDGHQEYDPHPPRPVRIPPATRCR